MPRATDIVDRFNAVDAHDDTVEGIFIVPAATRRSASTLEITLFRHWENKRRVLQINGCVNMALSVDMTVLADNAPNSTASVEAIAAVERIEKIMRGQKKNWNVTYEKAIDPLPVKLANAEKYVLFRVRFFGGALEVVARSFKIRRFNSSLNSDRLRGRLA